MKTIQKTIVVLLLTLPGFAQQDSLAELSKPYQTAMGILHQLQQSIPQDSLAIAQERQRLNTNYKRVADSLQQRNVQIGISFETQRLIDVINYRPNDAALDQQLKALYNHVAQHQNTVTEDNAQFTIIAQGLMGVIPEGESNETKIIDYNASKIRDLYKHLDTSSWSADKQQGFITTFATAYLKIGSVRKAEKLYRHFDTLFVKQTTTKNLKTFSLPDSISFQNPYLMLTTKNWSSLPKGKIVIRPKGENLFDLVYLVSLMRTIHREYAEEYDIVLVRQSYEEFNSYLSVVKQNLAFSDYYIATLGRDTLETSVQLPTVMMVNQEGEVTYQASHTNPLFKELNAPIEAKKEKEVKAYWADLDQKKDSLTQRAAQTKDSINYRATHENISFILKGLWDEGLSTQLTPVQWDKDDKVTDTTFPYMATFEVVHPQYKVYELQVLVRGKKQEITITSGFSNAKEVSYTKPEDAGFYQATQTIDKVQAQIVNYDYILEHYPFQNSAFVSYLHEALEQAKEKEQQAIKSVTKAKKILECYADEKRKQMKQMM